MGGGDIPYWPTFARLISSQHRFTRQHRQLVEDEPWNRSRHINKNRRGSDVDDFIYSCLLVPRAGGWHQIAVHGAWGDTPFADNRRYVVVLFHDELARLRQSNPATPEPGPFVKVCRPASGRPSPAS